MDLMLVDDPAVVPPDPAVQRLTLDGVKSVRIDSYKFSPLPMANMEGLPGVDDVLVFGVVPDGSTDEFMISCRHGVLPATQMRAGCDLVVESLRFRR
ncbi:hypothetical protein B0E54_05951 [Micromonospora sp. MH99]|nr:hypothetical protein [Micromonospora sp. MH99]